MKKNKNFGFTLLEILVVIGIISLMTISGYKYWSNVSTRSTAKNQLSYLIDLRKNIEKTFFKGVGINCLANNNFNCTGTSSIDYSTINNTYILNNKMVADALSSSGVLLDLYGGALTVSSTTVGGNSAYSIAIAAVPSKSCTIIAMSDFGDKSQEVWINGTLIKSQAVAQVPATAASACATTNSNTIDFRDYKVNDNVVVTTTNQRNKIDSFYVPVNGVNQSVTLVCGSGFVISGGYCSCPSGKTISWTASNTPTCVAYGSASKKCIYGKTYNPTTSSCDPLPPTTNPNHTVVTQAPNILLNQTSGGKTLSVGAGIVTTIAGGTYIDPTNSTTKNSSNLKIAAASSSALTPVANTNSQVTGYRDLPFAWVSSSAIQNNISGVTCSNGNTDGTSCQIDTSKETKAANSGMPNNGLPTGWYRSTFNSTKDYGSGAGVIKFNWNASKKRLETVLP